MITLLKASFPHKPNEKFLVGFWAFTPADVCGALKLSQLMSFPRPITSEPGLSARYCADIHPPSNNPSSRPFYRAPLSNKALEEIFNEDVLTWIAWYEHLRKVGWLAPLKSHPEDRGGCKHSGCEHPASFSYMALDGTHEVVCVQHAAEECIAQSPSSELLNMAYQEWGIGDPPEEAEPPARLQAICRARGLIE